MPKLIPLSQGLNAIVDDDWYEMLSVVSWTHNGCGYAISRANGKTELLHRAIMDAPKGMCVDHANGNPLDNRRENLRLCTRSQNNSNRRPASGTSRFKGIRWHKKNKNWNARITIDGKEKHLGCFASEEAAALAYDQKAIEVQGEFAYLNFPTLSPAQHA